MPLVCFIQMRIFIYLRFCVFWGFPLSLVWRFCFAVNLATFSLTYYAGRLMALSKKKLSLPFCMAYLFTACKTCLIAKR